MSHFSIESIVLSILNLFCWISQLCGIAIVYLATDMRGDATLISTVTQVSKDTWYVLVYTIVLGSFIFLNAFLGCCGAIRDKPSLYNAVIIKSYYYQLFISISKYSKTILFLNRMEWSCCFSSSFKWSLARLRYTRLIQSTWRNLIWSEHSDYTGTPQITGNSLIKSNQR